MSLYHSKPPEYFLSVKPNKDDVVTGVIRQLQALIADLEKYVGENK